MSGPPKTPVFLERASYRQRRLRDAARLIPFLGIILWTIPLLWPADASGSARAVMYVFGVWVVLIVITAAISRYLQFETVASDQDGDT